jgi:hypothetical protein
MLQHSDSTARRGANLNFLVFAPASPSASAYRKSGSCTALRPCAVMICASPHTLGVCDTSGANWLNATGADESAGTHRYSGYLATRRDEAGSDNGTACRQVVGLNNRGAGERLLFGARRCNERGRAVGRHSVLRSAISIESRRIVQLQAWRYDLDLGLGSMLILSFLFSHR